MEVWCFGVVLWLCFWVYYWLWMCDFVLLRCVGGIMVGWGLWLWLWVVLGLLWCCFLGGFGVKLEFWCDRLLCLGELGFWVLRVMVGGGRLCRLVSWRKLRLLMRMRIIFVVVMIIVLLWWLLLVFLVLGRYVLK